VYHIFGATGTIELQQGCRERTIFFVAQGQAQQGQASEGIVFLGTLTQARV
jgi:hypothetical protein